ncbi:MAG TPA: thioredoxin-disulfide reductase [Syntrophorhabdaceae bacterium]|nr:thioredoxin-disulfide reductase [Syntrophorhabdaceae bacterium]HPU28812.1 thioredoxin-disulfide reductase [Syntrophorhabdaceae bacterium]
MAEFHEAVIIGGGPAGLTAGLYLMRAGIDALLLEKAILGGAVINTWQIENYPGFPEGISGKDLMERFSAHAKAFNLKIKEFASVEEVSLKDRLFTVKTEKNIYESKGIIIATGTQSIKLGIPGEDRFLGRGISFCATCDGMFFKDLDVAVIGGGDAAIEEGLSLANIVKKVYVIHRRDTLRAQKILQERAFKNSKIEFLFNKRPVEFKGKDSIEYIVLEDTRDKNITELKVDGVFIYAGSRPDVAFLGDLVDTDEEGFIITDENLATKTKGLFAAGDVRKKRLRQVSTAVGDGALAAFELERYLIELKQ